MCRASRITTISALGMYLIRSTFALICPIPSSGGVPVRNKTCPDFKADPSFIYCCTSKLPPTSGIYREKHGGSKRLMNMEYSEDIRIRPKPKPMTNWQQMSSVRNFPGIWGLTSNSPLLSQRKITDDNHSATDVKGI
ncbi:hypothetical protein NECAME_12746 [Necator americanus]|uniref:Secreted protein n=1 Tax=Necator americanus TaxID=51031 RepID=W2SYP1_NECAM|nr:hypothetical protein NECAME_12746 [Necator americanus]ETN74760.1 hypothetical protein NECAME_12746 [Necator americanus]